MEFWEELSQRAPSLSHLDSTGVEYEKSVRGADKAFVAMLQLEPKNASAMRAYAAFLVDVGVVRQHWLKLHAFFEGRETCCSDWLVCVCVCVGGGVCLFACVVHSGIARCHADPACGRVIVFISIPSSEPTWNLQFAHKRSRCWDWGCGW